MKRFLLQNWVLLFGAASLFLAQAEPVSATRGLIERLLPAHADHFVLEVIAKDPQGDAFEIESKEAKVILRGNNGVALASALNWYLKYYCHAHVSWCGDQLNLPEPLPVVPEKVRRVTPFTYRYCFNYCAFSYSLAWWDWPQWERMIDWMALHGINMPLAVTGQEAVWQQVYRDLGLSDRQISEFFVGPAFLPFGWMGCLDGWCGPLPDSWIQKRAALERKILARERELGMTPVLQGFTGHVPAGLANLFPRAELRRLPSWCGFAPTHFVDPQDPLFVRIGKLFIEEQTRQFGTDHLYASDTFIEMQPPSSDPQFLAGMGKAVYDAMRAGDPQAIWVLQGWLFVNNPTFWQPPQGRALFGAVPDDRLVALDLYCESTPAWSKTDAFYGKPWIWCVIQNFGGTVSLHGALPRMAEDLAKALASPQRGRLSGIGLIFEGLDYNPIVQDFVTDMTWRSEVPKLDGWARDFVHRRYGRLLPESEAAWQLLRQTAFTQAGRSDTVLCARPSAAPSTGGLPYDPLTLVHACQKLLANADALGRLDTYQFDLVNVTRQALGSLGEQFHAQMAAAVQGKDRVALDKAGQGLLQLIQDVDDLLATRPEFLLGRWLAEAKSWASNDEERRLYERNARNLITLWGPPDSILHEYALRQWSGMFTGFYGRRWALFLDRQRSALIENKAFDAAKFEADVRAWEEQWTLQTESYPTVPKGDPVGTARRLLAKYEPLFEPEVVSLTTGKRATCSFSLPGYPASLANDGRRSNTHRYWATDVSRDQKAWWQVDLEKAVSVGRVVVVSFYGDERSYGFTVQVSTDGQQWDLVADRRDNRERSTVNGYACVFTPRPVRYIRVNLPHNSANTGRHLVEVMAYGK
ncbi:MAG: alpha-N-acetylglucosaminidase TIM-barrel domain-containing protein [Verrucomicrobiota bacterium]